MQVYNFRLFSAFIQVKEIILCLEIGFLCIFNALLYAISFDCGLFYLFK